MTFGKVPASWWWYQECTLWTTILEDLFFHRSPWVVLADNTFPQELLKVLLGFLVERAEYKEWLEPPSLTKFIERSSKVLYQNHFFSRSRLRVLPSKENTWVLEIIKQSLLPTAGHNMSADRIVIISEWNSNRRHMAQGILTGCWWIFLFYLPVLFLGIFSASVQWNFEFPILIYCVFVSPLFHLFLISTFLSFLIKISIFFEIMTSECQANVIYILSRGKIK